MNELDVTTGDGRTLRVRDDGDPGGVPILAMMGTPGSRQLLMQVPAAVDGSAIRAISYDRPGYGGSDRLPGRNFADCAGDVRAIAVALGIERLGVWGISGGGPHAIACAALLDGLVAAVGVVASPAPHGAPRLDWMAGMGEDNVEEFGAALTGEAACRALLDPMRRPILDADPEETVRSMQSLLSPVDAEIFTGAVAARISASMTLGLADGVDGWLDDDLAFVADWGFGLTQIKLPTLLIHGREDRFVPAAHGEWLAEAIPDAEARILDGEGHISIMENRIGELYEWLVPRVR